LRRYKRKSVKVGIFEGGGSLRRKFQIEGGVAHQPLLVSENLRDCSLVWYQNIRSVLFGFVTKHASDRWTELQQLTLC